MTTALAASFFADSCAGINSPPDHVEWFEPLFRAGSEHIDVGINGRQPCEWRGSMARTADPAVSMLLDDSCGARSR
jgi:hypothetical protein